MKRLLPFLPIVLSAFGSIALCSWFWLPKQALAFLSMLARAIPVSSVAADPETDDRTRRLLETVAAVREFATMRLALVQTRNYTTYVRLDRDHVATVVSACDALSFTRKVWNYPILGSLPYRGFFDKADAERLTAALRAEGYDVVQRGVSAFSSLGFFPDPLFSFMAGMDVGSIAELVIHELSHATIFLRGQDDFNEEFATFVGRIGAENYLEAHYGSESKELSTYRNALADSERFSSFLRATAEELGALYDSGIDTKTKRDRKAAILSRRTDEYRLMSSEFSGDAFRNFRMENVNNAYLDLYRLYEGEPELYRQYFKHVCLSDLRIFVTSVTELAKESSDIKEALRAAINYQYLH